MALAKHDLALLTARCGATRFGAGRFGFIPCEDDVEGSDNDEPGEYVWKEQTPASQMVVTPWALQHEDCVCRELCTLAVSSLTIGIYLLLEVGEDPLQLESGDLLLLEASSSTVLTDVDVQASVILSGIVGSVSGMARINWGDGRHDEQQFNALEENGRIVFEGHYHAEGNYTATITVTDERGCSVSSSLAVTVGVPAEPFVASFTWSKSGEDNTVNFTDTTVGADTWSWDFDEGDPPVTDQSPQNIFDDLTAGNPGEVFNYTVTLTASGPGGSDSATAILSISWVDGESGSGS